MNIATARLHVTMPDGSVWAIPVMSIGINRATYYAHEFGGDVKRSLAEDTIPCFSSDHYEVEDWAANNMNWVDVASVATMVQGPAPIDFQEGWCNGEKEVVGR